MKSNTFEIIKDHLFFNGMDKSYEIWTWHGEDIVDTYREEEIFNESDEHVLGEYNDAVNAVEMVQAAEDLLEKDFEKFIEYIEDAKKPRYDGCNKFTKLSTLV